MTVLLIALGAFIGAPARYLTDRAVQSRHSFGLPLGTVTVNVVASFVLGVVVGAEADIQVVALVGTGFCGALSTYSTFSYETMRLGPVRGAVNVALSLVSGIAAAGLGWWIGTR